MAESDSSDDTHFQRDLEDTVNANIDLETAEIATVSDLSTEVETLVEQSDGIHYDYILGDIANPSVSSSGHQYFTLESDDAELSCVVFNSRRSRLASAPDDDLRALVEGDLQYYAPHGKLSLQVTDCHAVGEGSYTQTYQQHKTTLAEEGLFDADRKQSLPTLPETIGIVTSANGDAVDDAIQSIHTRFPGVDILIGHAPVQGDDAVERIVTSIARLDQDPEIELIVVTRGGGADSTLRTFNEIAVCRTIARTDTPIAVGIGHENDETLAGRVADQQIITPTDAGSLVPDRNTLTDRVDNLATQLETAYTTHATEQLETLVERHQRTYERTVTEQLRALKADLTTATSQTIQTRLTDLSTDLETAYTTKQQTIDAKQEAKSAQRLNRLLVAVLLGLLVIVAALVIIFML